MNRPNPTRRWGLPAFAVVCALALPFALSGILNDSPTPDGSTGFAPGEAAMRASIDPETGALVPGPQAARSTGDKAMSAEMKNMMSRSTNGLVEEARPGGGVGVHLQGRFMNSTVVRFDENGHAESMCTEHAHEAAAFLAGESAQPETDANGWEVR